MKYIHEREIHLVNLDPAKGVEIKKFRPCLVLCKFSRNHLVILPLTSQEKKGKQFFKLEKISFLRKISWVCIAQIRVVDISRFVKKYGSLSEKKFKEIQKISGEVLKLLPKKANAQNTKKNSLLDQKVDPSLTQKRVR